MKTSLLVALSVLVLSLFVGCNEANKSIVGSDPAVTSKYDGEMQLDNVDEFNEITSDLKSVDLKFTTEVENDTYTVFIMKSPDLEEKLKTLEEKAEGQVESRGKRWYTGHGPLPFSQNEYCVHCRKRTWAGAYRQLKMISVARGYPIIAVGRGHRHYKKCLGNY